LTEAGGNYIIQFIFDYTFYFKIETEIRIEIIIIICLMFGKFRRTILIRKRTQFKWISTIWRFAKKRLGIIPAGKAQNCFGGEAKGLSKGRELHFLIFSTRPALFPEHVETEFEFPVVLDIVIGIDNTRVGGSTRTPRLSFRASFRGPDDDDDAIALSSAPSVGD